jgi:hypothetical protein
MNENSDNISPIRTHLQEQSTEHFIDLLIDLVQAVDEPLRQQAITFHERHLSSRDHVTGLHLNDQKTKKTPSNSRSSCLILLAYRLDGSDGSRPLTRIKWL